MEIKITQVVHSQMDDLVLISKNTFYETFVDTNSEEDMQKYLSESFSKTQLSLELKNEFSMFYFAEVAEEIVGYLKINLGDSQKEKFNEHSMEIERLYILKQFQGTGVAKLLVEKTFEKADEFEIKMIWLGVWEHNSRAIRFYEKNGFSAFDSHVFILGTDVQKDILMKLNK